MQGRIQEEDKSAGTKVVSVNRGRESKKQSSHTLLFFPNIKNSGQISWSLGEGRVILEPQLWCQPLSDKDWAEMILELWVPYSYSSRLTLVEWVPAMGILQNVGNLDMSKRQPCPQEAWDPIGEMWQTCSCLSDTADSITLDAQTAMGTPRRAGIRRKKYISM